ncbi:hypothetical protein PENSPDRAFT_444456 [Peniophora sp. CONT]|nr:hypothetical protein PENSPDRAFT_444456 [Peniophora sp. CONT]
MSGASDVIAEIDASLGKITVRVVTAVELEAVLFGTLTMALVSTLYTGFRTVIPPYFTRDKLSSLTRLGAFILLYALITCHWAFSIKYSQDVVSVTKLTDTYNSVLASGYQPLIAESVLFGMFCALVTLAIYVLVRKGLRARSQQVMLGVVLVMYAISLIHWVLQLLLIQPLGASFELLEIAESLGPLVLLSANVILSDAIVLWRMCVLCNQHIIARALAVTLLSSTIGLTAATIAAMTPIAEFGEGSDSVFSLSDTTYGTAVLGLSLASNVVATFSIGWRVWRYRRDISAHLASLNHQSIVEKVMTVLVESGFVYCIVWILYILDSVHLGPQFNAGTNAFGVDNPVWFSRLMPQLTGIYPTIIIVIVALEQSYLENAHSESKLSAFVAARPTAPQPPLNSHSRRTMILWRPTRSVGLAMSDFRYEHVSVDVTDTHDAADGASTVAAGGDVMAQHALQGDCGYLHSVHVEPR